MQEMVCFENNAVLLVKCSMGVLYAQFRFALSYKRVEACTPTLHVFQYTRCLTHIKTILNTLPGIGKDLARLEQTMAKDLHHTAV